MFYPQLFNWWIASISFNVLFVIAASIYLYRKRKNKQSLGGLNLTQQLKRLTKDFFFVWFFLVLLVFYVVSIGLGSYLFFLVGEVIVEITLLVYIYASTRSHSQRS